MTKSRNWLLSFVTSHFSDYAIVYDQSIENGDPVEPENPEDPEEPAKTIEMHRLYNPNSGEHFFTGNVEEKDHLVELGWNYEGVAWDAPEKSEIPVYRLYNPNAGDHHYTTDVKERDHLIEVGWNDEGIGWYSEESETVALFRLYNPNALGAGAHHFTADAAERDHLIEICRINFVSILNIDVNRYCIPNLATLGAILSKCGKRVVERVWGMV